MAARKPASKEEPKPIIDHGYVQWAKSVGKGPPMNNGRPWVQFNYDQWAFAYKIPVDNGGPDRVTCFKRMANALAPGYFEWHSWTEKMVEALCNERWISLAGCASSSKTFHVIGFACVWWLAQPDRSSVILCSTTKDGLRRRAWANVQKFYSMMPQPKFGNFISSRTVWQCTPGDDKHAIQGIAVEKGLVEAAADRIKGWHTDRQMVIVDEATAVPKAIFDACSNLQPGANREFLMVLMGNPRSRLDEFAKFCEPVNGWNSVTVADDEWRSKNKMDGFEGIVIRFDAEKSPNITEGKIVSKYLPTKEKVEATRKALGENNPLYWSNHRGFWAPEGLCKTIFSQVSIEKHGGQDRHEFSGKNFNIIGALDPARTGGDRAALRFAAIGELVNGGWGMEVMEPIIVALNARSTNPINYQLVEQTRRECEHVKWRGQAGYSCPPENLCIDGTGGGAGVVDVAQRIWSPAVRQVVFSAKPSDDSCTLEDIRSAYDVYHNKRVEMFYRANNALESGQLKGLDVETIEELCAIEFDDLSAKIKLMDKQDYKKKFGKSPDFADTIAILFEMARLRGFKISPVGKTVNRYDYWNKAAEITQSVYEDESFYAPADEELIGDLDG